MISYALDTNAAIALIGGKSAKLIDRTFQLPEGALALPTLVAHELYFGALRSQRVEHNLAMLRRLTSQAPVLDFDGEDIRASAEIRVTLFAKGTPIRPYDTLIAGQAKARGLTVITNNVREFGRVPGLKVEDWTL